MSILQQITEPGFMGHLVAIYYEGAAMLITLFLIIYLYRIYRISHIRLTVVLDIGFAFFLGGMFFSWLAKWYLWLEGTSYQDPYFWRLLCGFQMTGIFVIMANYFFSIFFTKLFDQNSELSYQNNPLLIRKSIEIIIILTISIPGYMLKSRTLILIGDAVAFLIMGIDCILVYIPNGTKCFKKAKSKSFKKQFVNIGLMSLSVCFAFFMVFADRLTMIIGLPGLIEGRYSIFYFATWAFIIIAMIFAIRAFITS